MYDFFSLKDGPKEITITSNNPVLKTITVKERDSIGPFRCQADCNPPCHISWTYDNSYKPVKVISPKIEIQANRSISRLQCIVKGETEQIAKNISLDIQCKYQLNFICLSDIDFLKKLAREVLTLKMIISNK